MVSTPFKECQGQSAMYSLRDLEVAKHADLRRMCALGYRLLKQMVYGSPTFALRLAEYIPFMQSQVGQGAADWGQGLPSHGPEGQTSLPLKDLP